MRLNVIIIIKKTWINRSPGPDSFTGEFYQTLKKVIHILQLSQKVKEEGKLPNILWGRHYSDTKTRKRYYSKVLQANIPDEHGKLLNKILANQNQYIKRLIHHDQMVSIPWIQRWFNILETMWFITSTKPRVKIISWYRKGLWQKFNILLQ